MYQNQVKRPLFKAIIFALISIIFMLIAGAIINLMQIAPNQYHNINILFLLIHTLVVGISVLVGIIIIKKLKWNFAKIGIKRMEKIPIIYSILYLYL